MFAAIKSQSGQRERVEIFARIARTVGIAREGLPIAGGIFAGGLLVWIFLSSWLGLALILASLAAGAFFRDPERNSTRPAGVLISGADGKVTDIVEMVLEDGSFTERCRRVSVFMSPLNVHVNRAPVSGRVLSVKHTPGEFRAAFRDDASEHNERNLIIFSDAAGRRYGMVQIAGYLARRIVCRLRPGDTIERGQRLGLIMFGSRVDHFMPLEYRVTVKPGDRVRAGESVIGEIKDDAQTASPTA